MSYTMTTKTFTTTNPGTICAEVATWLEEQIPEATLMYTGSTSVSYTKGSYLAFDGMSYGFCVLSYHNGDLARIGTASAHSISASSGTIVHQIGQGKMSLITENGVTSYSGTVAVIKTDSGYIISMGGNAMYIGYVTSALIGKRFVTIGLSSDTLTYCTRLCYSIYDSGSSFSLSHAEDASAYTNATYGTYCSEENNMPSGSAILSPLYVLHESLWAEPVVIPGVYYMQASSYPELFTPTQIGDKEAVLVGTNIAVV